MFRDPKKRSTSMIDTLIGAGTEMEGYLKSQAGIRIEGAFKGDIESKGDIVIGEGGVAKSNISARDVIIAGKVYGDVHTQGKLIITATGQLHGSALAAILNVHEGGILNGTSMMERLEDKQGEGKSSPGSPEMSDSYTDKKTKQAG